MFRALQDPSSVFIPRLKNRCLAWMHRLGFKRFEERVVELEDDLRLLIRAGTQDENIVREVWREGIYPVDSLGEGDVVVDVGAQIGSFSVLAASKGAIVHAFEPSPINLALLRHNVELNGLQERVVVHAAAVFRPGSDELRIFESYTNTGGHTAMGAIGPTRQVACTSLDEIFELHVPQRCRVVKIDAEGAEHAIIASASDETLARIDCVMAEVQDHPLLLGTSLPDEPPCTSAALLEFLRSHGLLGERDDHSWVAVMKREP